MNCHAQIWTNADLLEPVRHSWATGQSIVWTKVHDLPDYVYFNHSIHVNKGIGCSSCHGRVDEMPLMYQASSLQMEWCLNCHRNPAKNLRPTGQIYQMAWRGPSSENPVWCEGNDTPGVPTAQTVNCTQQDPAASGAQVAALELPNLPGAHPAFAAGSNTGTAILPAALHYTKFTDQESLGKYLIMQYHIKPPNELTSCDTCHR